mgnify:CR=1 FL=1
MYEVKFDGYRALLLKNGERVQIRSRNDKDLTNTYPSVAASGHRLRADQAVLDGEIVAVDAERTPFVSSASTSSRPSWPLRSSSTHSTCFTWRERI